MIRITVAVLLAIVTVPGGGARAAEAVAFDCSGRNGIAAMENSYVDVLGQGPCWGHLGHHTYDTGAVHEVGLVEGRVFSVEIQFSPPLEYAAPDAAALVVEGSVDARAWSPLHQIPYPLLVGQDAVLPSRQGIEFSFDAGGARARWIRIRQPLSTAQGLSGYLDSSRFTAELTSPGGLSPTFPPPDRYGCATDIMEGVTPGHPCWFGGINRYDAPSVFHTYFVARPDIVSARGTVTFLPWRSDDYTQNGGSRREITGMVQMSTDGVTWSDVATVAGPFGLPLAFDVTFDELTTVGYVRFVAERHPGYTTHPALKHARAFVVDSALELGT